MTNTGWIASGSSSISSSSCNGCICCGKIGIDVLTLYVVFDNSGPGFVVLAKMVVAGEEEFVFWVKWAPMVMVMQNRGFLLNIIWIQIVSSDHNI